MRMFIGVAFLLALLTLPASAQDQEEPQQSFDYYLELITEISSRSEEETDFNDLAVELYELWESPVDINSAEPYELSRLFWLSELQLNHLISYVQQHKPVVSIYEFTYIPGFDSTLVQSIKPFIKLVDAHTPNFRPKAKNWLMVRAGRTLDEQKGFMQNKFEGDAWKQNLRYKYQYGEKVQAGFNLEKDAGESNKKGPDFYSGYIKINNIGIIKTVCIGNYSIGFGQGLVLGPGFALGKSSQVVNLIQKETGIKPYTSSDENRYFQGAATTISSRPVDISLFFSYKKVDANILERNSSNKPLVASSLQNTGYHSTSSEIEDENSLSEISTGGRLLYRSTHFQSGLTFIYTKFNAQIIPEPAEYNQFYFRGDRQYNASFDYKYNFANTTLFGEAAIDKKGYTAFINGVTTNIANRIELILLHRYYSRSYNSLYGNAFGENTKVQNEEGVFGGFRMPLFKHINFAFYADFFQFPWMKYMVDAPSNGREYMFQLEYNPNNVFSAYAQYRMKQKQRNYTDSLETYNYIADTHNQRFRLHFRYQASERITLSTRFETGSYRLSQQKLEKSYLIYQDVQYSFQFPVHLYLRYALFNADSYDSRLYAYESDVLYAFSVSSYFRQGQRFYAMLKYSPVKNLAFWIKYSQSVYPQETSLSTGLYEIQGNCRNDIRLQMILKF